MRPAPESVTPPAPRTGLHLLPPPPPPPPEICDISKCRWTHYTASGGFATNAIMILIILLCALISAVIINTAIRCCCVGDSGRRRGRRPAPHRRQQQQQLEPKLADSDLIAAPAVTYTPGVTRLAGTEAECAICLTEFVDGDGIRVLATCSHGFHVECIERWLRSHKSCPTCRSSLVVDRSGSSESAGVDHCRENAGRRTDSAGESLSGGAAST